MSDIVDIGLKVDSSSVKKGTGALKRFGNQAGKAERATDRMKKSIFSAGLAFKALGVAMAGLLFRKIIRNTIEQEAALRQVEQGLISTGNAAGFTLKELKKMAAGFQKVTNFGDEAILRVQSKILTFTAISKKTFGATTEAVLDLATRMEGDLNGAVVQLGKVLNDPVRNLSLLSRQGVQFNKQQTAMIKRFVETNQIAKAQGVILKELKKEFGGSARAARDTFGGALKSLGNAFGDLLEAKGGLKEAKGELEATTKLLQDPKTIKAADQLMSALIKGFTKVVGAIPTITKFLNRFFGTSSINETALQREIRLTTEALRIQKEEVKRLNAEGLPGPLGDVVTYKLSVVRLTAKLKALEAQQKALNKPTKSASSGTKSGAGVAQGPTPEEIKAAEAAKNIIDLTKAKFARMHELALEADATDSERAQLKLEFDLQQMQTDFDNLNLNETQKATLRDAFEQARIDRAQQTAVKLGKIDADLEKKKIKAEKRLQAIQLQNASQLFGDLSSLMQTGSRKLFEIGKAAAIAQAVVNVAQGVTKALGQGGFFGIAMGAAVAAAGAVQIAKIASTQFNGGQGGSVAVGGASFASSGGGQQTATVPQSPAGQQIQRVTNVTLSIDSGGIFTGNEVRTLIEAINEQVGDGVKLAVNA